MLLSTLPPHRKTQHIHRNSTTSLASQSRAALALCTPPSSGRVSTLSTVPELRTLPEAESQPGPPHSARPITYTPPKQVPDGGSVDLALAHVHAPGPRLTHSQRRSRDANDRGALVVPAVGPAAPIMADRLSAHDSTRDSHEISMSLRDVTRDSLVANMLMSLDQFSFGDTGGGAAQTSDHGPANVHERYGSRPWTDNSAAKSSGHWRGHKSSLSSDLETTSTLKERGRGGIQETLSYRNQPVTPPRRSSHNRGGKHSNKSSSSASVDLGHSKDLVSERLARSFGRSSSFDYGHDRPQTRSTTHLQKPSASSSFKVDFPDAYDDYEYGAAPTPTVPSGPRRDASSIPIPPPPPEPAETRTLDRKKSASTRSLKSSSGRSRRGTSHQTSTPAPAPVLMSREELESAPAPSVGYGKSKDSETLGVTASQAKDRPGFFRRVFGSSKVASSPSGSLPVSQSSAAFLPSPTDRLPPHQQYQMQTKTSAPPSRDTSSSHSHLHQHPPPLQKKSSSFFRRRKKSVVDGAPSLPNDEHAPPMPTMDHAAAGAKRYEQMHESQGRTSPASSLREVMNPYLQNGDTGLGLTGVSMSSPLADITNNRTPERNQRNNHDEYKKDFSPDYVPSPKARIRTVETGPDGERFDVAATPSRGPTKATNKKPQGANDSFLNLDGGNEFDGDKNRNRTNKENGSTRDYGASEDRDATLRARKGPFLDVRDSNRPALALPRNEKRSTSLASGSTETDYKTAPSVAPSLQVEDKGSPVPGGKHVLGTLESINACKSLDEPEFVVGDPTEDDRQKARKIYEGSSEYIQKDRAAAWMGEQGPVRQRTLQAYMELYDFTGLSILSALRKVCGRLVMRGETQQVDRILVAFSKRWCSCNPRHGFKATGTCPLPPTPALANLDQTSFT